MPRYIIRNPTIYETPNIRRPVSSYRIPQTDDAHLDFMYCGESFARSAYFDNNNFIRGNTGIPWPYRARRLHAGWVLVGTRLAACFAGSVKMYSSASAATKKLCARDHLQDLNKQIRVSVICCFGNIYISKRSKSNPGQEEAFFSNMKNRFDQSPFGRQNVQILGETGGFSVFLRLAPCLLPRVCLIIFVALFGRCSGTLLCVAAGLFQCKYEWKEQLSRTN